MADLPESGLKSKKKARIIKADESLKQRIGTGPLDHCVVDSCEEAVRQLVCEEDFTVIGQEFLDKLEKAIVIAKEDLTDAEAMNRLTSPVMQLKGSSKIYGYALVGQLASIMLGFLEKLDKLDKDVIEIVQAHHKTLSIILSRDIKGDGGSRGVMFERELQNACNRYFEKKS